MAMGDAAPYLMRSVSQPLFASREFKEGDPLRALTTSISFGRFMTEPLDWEKWSSFSHNRTREDVQKHSRPGAVAEKKAFFEAYFNKCASKKSSKPPQKENRPPNYSPKTNVSPVAISNKLKNQSPTVANRGAELAITSNQDVSSPCINLVFSEKRNVDDIISSSGQMKQEKTSTGNVSSPIVLSNRGVEREISSKEDVCSPLTNLVVFPEIGTVDEKPSTNLVCSQFGNVEENVSRNKRAEGEIASNKDVCSNLVFSDVGNIDDIISSGGQTEQEKTSTEIVSLENHCLEVKVSNQSSHVDKNKKRKIKDNNISGQTKTKISSVKSSSRKAPILEIQPKNQIFKHNLRMSSVNGVKKSTHAIPRLENKRSKPLLDRSVNANITVAWKKNTQALPRSENKWSKPLLDHSVNANKTVVLKKNIQALSLSENKWSKPLLDRLVNANKRVVLNSHSTNHSEALIASTKKPRSVTVATSFSFKSDERAAKRKQFFQKLEEKPKLKEKDDKKLRWSTAREAKQSTSQTKGPANKIQKVQPAQTCPQKLGMKPKNFIEINKKKLSSSMACLPSKRSHG